ncbi:MAG: hypothetical protein PHI12_09000 [Dehalococcoidales bacterium]|nr:hypothetical protein [Dehalococcoidales bacterium]
MIKFNIYRNKSDNCYIATVVPNYVGVHDTLDECRQLYGSPVDYCQRYDIGDLPRKWRGKPLKLVTFDETRLFEH